MYPSLTSEGHLGLSKSEAEEDTRVPGCLVALHFFTTRPENQDGLTDSPRHVLL
jgi:hypothetical protein